MAPDERAVLDEPESTPPPPAADDPATPTPTPGLGDDFPETPPPPDANAPRNAAKLARPAKPRGGWGVTDAAVVLLALGVLILSAAGWWLLGR
jgi:hypothetical protein